MTEPPLSVHAGLVQQAQAALCTVARALARTEGRRQHYALPRVQAVTAAIGLDRELAPWVFAALVARADFDAFFALRDTPGSYVQLRTALSATGARRSTTDLSDPAPDDPLASVLEWLDLAADARA